MSDKPKYTKEWVSGSAKKVEFSNGGHIINVSFAEEDLAKFRRSESKGGRVFLSFTLASKEEADQYGNHYSQYVSKPEGEVNSAPEGGSSDDSDDDGWG